MNAKDFLRHTVLQDLSEIKLMVRGEEIPLEPVIEAYHEHKLGEMSEKDLVKLITIKRANLKSKI